MNKYHLDLICSYKLWDYCKNRYKKRKIYPEAACCEDDFYYFGRNGKVRIVKNKKEIWITGDEFPQIIRRR